MDVKTQGVQVFCNAEGTAEIFEVQTPHFFHMRLQGTLSMDTYKEAFNKMKELMPLADCPRLMYDARDLEASDPEARAWLTRHFFPEATQIFDEPLVAALILPKSIFMKMVVNMVAKMVRAKGNDVVLKSFSNEEEGAQWLAEKQRESKYA